MNPSKSQQESETHPTPQLIAPTLSDIKRECMAEPMVFDNVRPDLCGELEQFILMLASNGRSAASINRGGWKSGKDLFPLYERSYPVIAEIAHTIESMIGARSLYSWAMVNRYGSEHPRHQHSGATVMAVYYVTTGDPLVPTRFECKDEMVEVMPHPGRLIVSPGEMWHSVPPYHGETPRITLAVDFRR